MVGRGKECQLETPRKISCIKQKNNSNMKETKRWHSFEQLRRVKTLKWKENMCSRNFGIPQG